jgi:uncharacterized protein
VSALNSCLYLGDVVHRRVRPVQHILRYRVYNFFVDVDELSELGKRLKLFSYNRINLFSIDDRKFGAGDGTPIREHVWGLVRASSCSARVKRIFMLCYPAVLGRVFNPLTTYYCYDCNEQLCLMIYEVSNTFGERHSYVMPFGQKSQHSHVKKLYVSPFNKVEGQYDFTVRQPGAELTLGVSLRVDGSALMQASFHGRRQMLSDRALAQSFLRFPLQPLKVVVGIHWEALKLWIKGLRPAPRPPKMEPHVSFAEEARAQFERQK